MKLKKIISIILTTAFCFNTITFVFADQKFQKEFSENSVKITSSSDDIINEVIIDEDDVQDSIESINPIEDFNVSNSSVDLMTSETTFAYLDIKDDDGNVLCTLNIDYEYKYYDKFTGQIAAVYAPLECDVEIPSSAAIKVGNDIKDIKLESIKNNAFERCNLKSIKLPSSIHEIGEKAFLDSPNLESIYIDGHITNEDVYLNSSGKFNTIVTTIKDYAFAGCTQLKDVYISGFQKMGNYLFSGCSSLTNVEFNIKDMYQITNSIKKENLTMTLGNNTFENCTSLKEITIPEFMKTIGTNAFLNCTSLEKFYLDGTAFTGTLNASFFSGCSNMKEVNIIGENANPTYSNKGENVWHKTYMSVEGVLYKRNIRNVTDYETGKPLFENILNVKMFVASSLLYYPPKKETEEFTLPDTTTSIASNAVKQAINLKKFIIKTSPIISYSSKDGRIEKTQAVSVGNNSFENCAKLESIELHNVSSFGTSCFKDCVSLNNIIWSDFEEINGGTLGANCFENTGFTEIELSGFISVGNYAFKNCIKMTKFDAGYGMGTFGNYIFNGCTALKSSDISKVGMKVNTINPKITFGTNIYQNCTALETVMLPSTLLGISSYTFAGCTALKKVVLDFEDCGTISNSAFEDCVSLEEAPTPRFLVKIDSKAFYNCSSLEKYKISRSVVNISDNAFYGCEKLIFVTPATYKPEQFAISHSIKYENYENDIEDWEFLICEEVSSEVIDGEIVNTYITTGYRGGFETLTIDIKNLKYISSFWINNPYTKGNNMNVYLKKLDIYGINKVESSAFSNCKVLEEVNFYDDDLTILANGTFNNCISLAKATFDKSILNEIGSSAFYNCTSLEEIILDKSQLRTIGSKAFYNCKLLKYIKLPLSLTNTYNSTGLIVNGIGEQAFYNCTSLLNVDFDDTKIELPTEMHLTIGKSAFESCRSLVSIKIPYICDEIGESAFKNCVSLEKVKFNAKLKTIGKTSFMGNSKLTTVTIPHNVYISLNAFKDCRNIHRIIVPHTVNIAPSNKPFENVENPLIVCKKDSQAEENAKDMGILVEYAEFVEGIESVLIKGKITIPENIVVTRNGIVLTENDYIIENDELTIHLNEVDGKNGFILVNDKVVENDSVYIVGENENVTISVSYQSVPCTINYGENILIEKVLEDGNTIIESGKNVFYGDRIKIKFVPKNQSIKLDKITVNDIEVNDEEIYTVKENLNIVAHIILNVLYGDVNNDSVITSSDSATCLQYVLNNDSFKMTDEIFVTTDVDLDKLITASDAALIFSKVLDNEFIFPCLKNL